LNLGPNTGVRLTKSPDSGRMQMDLERGIARFRSTEQTPLDASLADATIRTAAGAGAGYIAMTSADAALIGAEKGALVVTTEHDGNSVTVPEGSAMSVRLADPDPQAKYPHVRKSHAKVLIFGGLAVAALIGTAIYLNTSQTSSNKTVSPFKP